jgi:hypothetical protein
MARAFASGSREAAALVSVRETWLVECPIAHRGLHSRPHGIAENSIESIIEAYRHNIPVEIDLQLTADEDILVTHDWIDATLPAGEIIRSRFETDGVRIPTLSEVLKVVDGRIPLLLELKTQSSGTPLVKVFFDHMRGYRGEYAVCSFNPFVLWRLRQAGYRGACGQNTGELQNASWLMRVIGRSQVINFVTKPNFLVCELASLQSKPILSWRRRGLPILVWSVKTAMDEDVASRSGDNFLFSEYGPQKRCNMFRRTSSVQWEDLAVKKRYQLLRRIVDANVIRPRNRYRRRAYWVRQFFRSTGALVILASVFLPFVAGKTFDNREIVIAVLGLLIAALTSLRNFFRWDTVWRLMRNTEFELTFKIAAWEAEFSKLESDPRPEDNFDYALEVTKVLLEDAGKIIRSEASQYFDLVSWPSSEGGQPRKDANAPAG